MSSSTWATLFQVVFAVVHLDHSMFNLAKRLMMLRPGHLSRMILRHTRDGSLLFES